MKNKTEDLPGTLFKIKKRFFCVEAEVVPGEILMYLGSKFLRGTGTWKRYKHKFLNKNGQVICWQWSRNLDDLINTNVIERIEL